MPLSFLHPPSIFLFVFHYPKRKRRRYDPSIPRSHWKRSDVNVAVDVVIGYKNKGRFPTLNTACMYKSLLSFSIDKRTCSPCTADTPTVQEPNSSVVYFRSFPPVLSFCRSFYLLNKGVTYSLFFCWYLLSKQNRRQQKTPWKNQPYYWSGYILVDRRRITLKLIFIYSFCVSVMRGGAMFLACCPLPPWKE